MLYGPPETELAAVAVVLKRGQRRQAGRGVAVDKAAVAGRQAGQCRAISLGLVVGRDRQGDRRYRERTGNVADRVVRVHGAAGGDAVRPAGNRTCRRGRGAERRQRGQAGRRIAVDKAAVAGRQAGQCRAVSLGLVVGRDRQGDRRDRERTGNVADRVVRVHGAAGGDGVRPAGNRAGRRGRRA